MAWFILVMTWFILVRAWSELGYGLVMVVCTSEPAFRFYGIQTASVGPLAIRAASRSPFEILRHVTCVAEFQTRVGP